MTIALDGAGAFTVDNSSGTSTTFTGPNVKIGAWDVVHSICDVGGVPVRADDSTSLDGDS
jgi:hypothetical protein